MKFPGIHHNKGFSLIELLVSVSIITLMTSLVVPAFTSILKSNGTDSAVCDIKGAIEAACSYARANNTYTWVGFYEEDVTAAASIMSPPYTGRGRVLIAVVASKDGTAVFGSNDPAALLPSDRISALGKIIRLENVHLMDIGAPTGTNADPKTLEGRSGFPYDDNEPQNGGQSHYSRISSESSDRTLFPFTAQGYTFYKTIRFNPRGEADINGTFNLRSLIEIGLKPTSGTAVLNSPNVAAVQISGIAGNATIYRR